MSGFQKLCLFYLCLVEGALKRSVEGQNSICFSEDEFVLVDTLVIFESAKIACAVLGGALARISSADEYAFAVTLIEARTDENDDVWIGNSILCF